MMGGKGRDLLVVTHFPTCATYHTTLGAVLAQRNRARPEEAPALRKSLSPVCLGDGPWIWVFCLRLIVSEVVREAGSE